MYMGRPLPGELGKTVQVKDSILGRIRGIDKATEAIRLLQERGGSVGFSDNPDDLSQTGGVQIEIFARVDGRKSKIRVEKNKKQVRGSALIIKRSYTNQQEEFLVVPNDSRMAAQLSFTLDDARKVFPDTIFQHLQNAIHQNLEHRRAGIRPLKKKDVVYKSS